MTTIDSSLIGKVVRFETNAPMVLGARFTDAKVLAILDAATAAMFVDVLAQHTAVFPWLPVGVLDDYTSYNYVKLELSDQSVIIMGIPWINESSVEVIASTDIVIKLKGRGHQDINIIRQSLLANGFEGFTIEVVS